MIIYLNNITDFFRPNRLIWQYVEEPGSSNIDTDAESDAGSNADIDSDTDFFDTESVPDKEAGDDKIDAVLDFANRTCQFVQKEGGSAKTIAEEQVCHMKQELEKIEGLQLFIDELYEKFLRLKDNKDTFQRFEALESECDIERIIKCFDRGVVDYTINIYTNKQFAENPNLVDHIVFTYKDRTTETINLELTEEGKTRVFAPVAVSLLRAKALSEQQDAEQRWRENHPMHDPWKKWREKYEDTGGEKSSEEKQQPSEQQFSDPYSDQYYDAFKIEEEQTRQE